MSQSKLSGRINLVMAHMGGTQWAVMEGKESSKISESWKNYSQRLAGKVLSLMLNPDLILKAFLGSLVPWSEGSYYFFFFFFFLKHKIT